MWQWTSGHSPTESQACKAGFSRDRLSIRTGLDQTIRSLHAILKRTLRTSNKWLKVGTGLRSYLLGLRSCSRESHALIFHALTRSICLIPYPRRSSAPKRLAVPNHSCRSQTSLGGTWPLGHWQHRGCQCEAYFTQTGDLHHTGGGVRT